MYNFSPFKDKIKSLESWLAAELIQIRTGRATPALLDSVKVDSYGSKVPVNQVAGITTEDPRTLRVSPWDSSIAKEIEKAIMVANLGVSVALDDKGVRVFFPELTAERRTMLTKLVKEKLESARTTLRGERDKVSKDIEAKEKQGGMGEDDKFRLKTEMQKLVDEANKKLGEVAERKEKEIAQ